MEDIKPELYYEEIREEMLQYVPQHAKYILEIGCGQGKFGSALKKRNQAEVWGIELDQASADVAKQKLDRILVGDIFKLIDELPDNYFDTIVCNDVLEHLLDPYSVLERLKSKLKVNGLVVSSIPNIRYFRALIEIVWKQQWQYTDKGTFDRTHLRFFTKKSIADMYMKAGYKILKMEGIGKTKSIRPFLLNILFLGKLSDTKYLQFATVATPHK
jgi:2-polyprenyl-3-methyl-5-hydroxy-6-metoxy-1,4-benzoquinol methylase